MLTGRICNYPESRVSIYRPKKLASLTRCRSLEAKMPDSEQASEQTQAVEPDRGSSRKLDRQDLDYYACPFYQCETKRFKNVHARYYHLRPALPRVECPECHESFTKGKFPGHNCEWSESNVNKGPRPRSVKNQCAQQWQIRFKPEERTSHLKRTDFSGPHLRYQDINSHGKTSLCSSVAGSSGPFTSARSRSAQIALCSQSEVQGATSLPPNLCFLTMQGSDHTHTETSPSLGSLDSQISCPIVLAVKPAVCSIYAIAIRECP